MEEDFNVLRRNWAMFAAEEVETFINNLQEKFFGKYALWVIATFVKEKSKDMNT